MDSADRIQALEILGFGTSSKILSNPYPMGGYPGLEIGLSLESVNIDKLSSLGDTTDPQDALVYPTLSIGKGLYNNFDLYVHFIPFLDRTGISEFGAFLRWGLYTPSKIPFSFSLIVHANSINIDNKITSRSLGTIFTGSFHVSGFAIYAGFGVTQLKGTFVGVTDTAVNESEKTDGTQWLIGTTYNFEPIFLAFQMDQFNDRVYSGKIGYRF